MLSVISKEDFCRVALEPFPFTCPHISDQWLFAEMPTERQLFMDEREPSLSSVWQLIIHKATHNLLPPFTFFFLILSCGCFSLLSTCGPAYPIRLWNSQQRDAWQCQLERTELRLLFTCTASSLSTFFRDCLHRLLCKQMSFSCCAGSTTWRDLLRAARQGRACIFGNMSTSKRTSRQLKASHSGFVLRVRPNF